MITNDIHLHLAINHLPVIIPVIALLVMAGGIVFKSNVVRRTAYLLFILGGASAFPAYQSGERAEEIAEEIRGIDEGFIHEHEEAAERFAYASYALAGLALVGLLAGWKGKPSPLSTAMLALTVIGALGVLYVGREAATSGGEIRHPEIREGFDVERRGVLDRLRD